MKRLYQRGEIKDLRSIAINHDVSPIELGDGRVVLLTGLEVLQAGLTGRSDPRLLEYARQVAYDEERLAMKQVDKVTGGQA